MRLPCVGLLLIVSLAACNSTQDPASMLTCGPNGSCPAGYVCDGKSNLCILSSSQTVVDAASADHDARTPADAGGADDASAAIADASAADAAPRVAALSIAPTSQDFAQATLGSVGQPLTFTVTNEGDLPTGVLGAVLSDDTSYALSGGSCAGARLQGGERCTVLVQFAPTGEAGGKPATLRVSDGQLAPAMAALTGTALTPGVITLAPQSKDFGLQAIGTAGAEAVFTVRNTGQAHVGPLVAALSDATSFAISSNDCPAMLDGGATCSIGVTLRPQAIGAVQGVSLTVSSTAGGNATSSLAGTGGGELQLENAGGGRVVSTPNGIDCATSCSVMFTESPILLNALPDARHTFGGWSGACSGGARCQVSLTAATTPVTARFDVIPAKLRIAPTAQSFGSVALGDASDAIAFTVTNDGGELSGPIQPALSDESYQVTGGTCPGTRLAAGGRCTVEVRLAPVAPAGPKAATLTVSAQPGGSAVSMLDGVALTAGVIEIAPPSADFGAVSLGASSAATTFTVTNTGEAPTGPVTTAFTDAASFTVADSTCGAALAPGASCTVAVAFRPAAVGLTQGVSLTVTGSPGGTAASGLRGSGTAKLSVTNAGGGTVASDLPGIACGATCIATFSESPVELTATPDALHTFGDWSPPCAGMTKCRMDLVAADNPVTATFVLRPAAISVAPPTQGFGAVVLGSASDPVTFTVSNGGGAASGTLSAAVSDTTSYSVTGGTCIGATIASGATCTVLVRFNPTGQAGSKPATLTVSATPGGSPISSLSGTALAPGALAIAPTSKDFGSVSLGAASSDVTFTVTNGGGSPTGTLATSLTDQTNFTIQSNGCGAALAAGVSCTVVVAFKPGSVGLKQGVSLSVSSTPGGSAPATLKGTGTAQVSVTNAGGGVVKSDAPGISCGLACVASFSATPVGLTATADAQHTFTGWGPPCSGTDKCNLSLVAADNKVTASFALNPALSIAPPTQDFGSVIVGGMSSAVTFTVSNPGGLPTGTIAASVSDTTSYTLTGGSCQGATLAAGASCTVIARFNPTGQAGSRPATLSVTASPGGSSSSTLSGTALAPAALGISPTTKDYGSVAIGSTSGSQSFTVQNGGGAGTGSMTTSLTDTTNFTIVTNGCTGTLAGGASCTVTVAFKPTSVGLKQGVTLKVSATPGGDAPATLKGTGTAQVQVTNAGGGLVTSVPAAMSCQPTCTVAYSDAMVTLKVAPDSTHRFTGWSGSGCSGTGDCVVSMDAAVKMVTAAFEEAGPFTITTIEQGVPRANDTVVARDPDNGPPVFVTTDAQGHATLVIRPNSTVSVWTRPNPRSGEREVGNAILGVQPLDNLTIGDVADLNDRYRISRNAPPPPAGANCVNEMSGGTQFTNACRPFQNPISLFAQTISVDTTGSLNLLVRAAPAGGVMSTAYGFATGIPPIVGADATATIPAWVPAVDRSVTLAHIPANPGGLNVINGAGMNGEFYADGSTQTTIPGGATSLTLGGTPNGIGQGHVHMYRVGFAPLQQWLETDSSQFDFNNLIPAVTNIALVFQQPAGLPMAVTYDVPPGLTGIILHLRWSPLGGQNFDSTDQYFVAPPTGRVDVSAAETGDINPREYPVTVDLVAIHVTGWTYSDLKRNYTRIVAGPAFAVPFFPPYIGPGVTLRQTVTTVTFNHP